MARPSAFVREVELGLQARPTLGEAGVFKRIFEAVSEDPDMEYAMIDATIVKVHRHGQGAKGGLRARPSATPKAA
jgi:transposase